MSDTTAEKSMMVAYLIPYLNTGSVILEQTILVLIAFVVIGIFLLVWAYSTFVLVRGYNLSAIQQKELSLKAVRLHGLSILATGGIIILIAASLFVSLYRLYLICNQVTTSLDTLQQRLEEDSEQNKSIRDMQNTTYEGFAFTIARLLETYPETASRDNLQKICDTIGADYIMLFDRDGKETVSNSPYIGVSLSVDPSKSSATVMSKMSSI